MSNPWDFIFKGLFIVSGGSVAAPIGVLGASGMLAGADVSFARRDRT